MLPIVRQLLINVLQLTNNPLKLPGVGENVSGKL